MHRAVRAAIFYAAPVTIATVMTLAGLATWRELTILVLLALLWYPLDWLLNYLAGWGPRRPTDQDRT